MIPDWETDFLYFSNLLPKKQPKLYKNLIKLLRKAKIKYGFLPHTKDIWCRDYMPVQIDKNKFVQFRYDPDYLKPEKFAHLKSEPAIINSHLGISPKYSNLILDGGNIVFSERAVILTDKVFKENPTYSKDVLIQTLTTLFETEEIYFIPKQPYDIYGHADGMIRFVSNDTVILNDFSKESKSFQKKLEKFLKNLPFRVFFLKIPFEHKLNWCYINYIHIKNQIIIPVINHLKEEKVLYQFEEIFKGHKIWTLYSEEILIQGGGLHCISWNIKKS